MSEPQAPPNEPAGVIPVARSFRWGTLVVVAAMGTTGVAWVGAFAYPLICQRLGIEVPRAGPWAQDAAIASTDSPSQRRVQVRFAGVAHAGTPVDFYPVSRVQEVTLGKTSKVMWRFTNLTDKALEIQAVHSVSPPEYDALLHKVECFCFTRQTLKPRESKAMPVIFRLDPKLGSEVEHLTLGYTLYNLQPQARELLPSEKRDRPG